MASSGREDGVTVMAWFALAQHEATAPVLLPPTMRQAVRAEWRRALHPPYTALAVVAVNGLLMTGAWLLLPKPNLLFTLHGALAYPIVLSSWMYADVPATNVLGPDAARAAAALSGDDLPGLRRMLYAKNLVLWLLVAPLCSVIAVLIGVHEHRIAAGVLSVVYIAVAPLGALGLAGWVGVWWPYHELPLRYRWERRRPFTRMIVRWLTLAVLPYGVVPALAIVVSLPAAAYLWFGPLQGQAARIQDGALAVAVALSLATSVAAWLLGQRVAARMAYRRRDRLVPFLADPDRG